MGLEATNLSGSFQGKHVVDVGTRTCEHEFEFASAFVDTLADACALRLFPAIVYLCAQIHSPPSAFMHACTYIYR